MKKHRITSLLALLLSALLLCGCGSSSRSDAKSTEAYSLQDSAYEEYIQYEPIPAPMEAPAMAEGGIANSNGRSNDKEQAKGQLQTEKIIYSAYAEVETVDYETTVAAVSAMVERFGGFIESSSISGANYYRSSRGLQSLRSASFTLRIPSEHFEELTTSLSELGSVPYCNTSSENVTATYYDVEARKTAYETQEKRLLEMLEIAETVEDLLAIQSQLTDVQYEIDSLQSRLTNYDRQVSYSTVNLTVSEVEEYTETPIVKLSYGEKLSQSFKNSCKTVGEFFVDSSLWLMGNLPEILLWCAILFGCWKLLAKLFSRRKKKESTPRKSWKERRAEKKAMKTQGENAPVSASVPEQIKEQESDK